MPSNYWIRKIKYYNNKIISGVGINTENLFKTAAMSTTMNLFMNYKEKQVFLTLQQHKVYNNNMLSLKAVIPLQQVV